MSRQDDFEPKVTQRLKVIGRTIYCYQCNGTKEIAQFYCICGVMLCAFHILTHKCLVISQISYYEELKKALT